MENKQIKILSIDDDLMVNELNRMIFKIYSPGTELIVIPLATEALKYLDHCDDLPDAILLDIKMPIMNGWEFLEKFSSKKIDIPVFMLTTSIYYRDREESMKFDAVKGFIEKPLYEEKIEMILKQVRNKIADC